MAGLPSKYMKNLKKYGGMAGAWKAYRSETGGGSSSSSSSSSKRKSGGGGNAVVAYARRSGGTYVQKVTPFLGQAAVGVVGAGAVAAGARFIPFVNAFPTWGKGAVQLGIGVSAMLLPWRLVQAGGLGASIMGLSTIVRSLFAFETTFNGPRSMSAEEIAAMSRGILNGPVNVMQGPAAFMNGPANFALNGGEAFGTGFDATYPAAATRAGDMRW